MILYYDKRYGFYELFNDKNGALIRGDVNGYDPTVRSFPELIDVGIMGHCSNSKYCKSAGIDCYQRGGNMSNKHMSVANFEKIASQASGKTFQIALGGAGDPDKHPDFEDILRLCRKYCIVPNITTSGYGLTDYNISLIKKYCGAVAVSWYSRLINGKESNESTVLTVEKLILAGCITNIHFVVSDKTIDEAIDRLKGNLFPNGFNAVVFILYKAVGDGITGKEIRSNDYRLEEFLDLALNQRHPFEVGFDTCFTPALLNFESNVSPQSIDACEAGTFSMYVDSNMNCYPCSFGLWRKELSVSLNDMTLQEAWDSDTFQKFRENLNRNCKGCRKFDQCLGGCRLMMDINLCKSLDD